MPQMLLSWAVVVHVLLRRACTSRAERRRVERTACGATLRGSGPAREGTVGMRAGASAQTQALALETAKHGQWIHTATHQPARKPVRAPTAQPACTRLSCAAAFKGRPRGRMIAGVACSEGWLERTRHRRDVGRLFDGWCQQCAGPSREQVQQSASRSLQSRERSPAAAQKLKVPIGHEEDGASASTSR